MKEKTILALTIFPVLLILLLTAPMPMGQAEEKKKEYIMGLPLGETSEYSHLTGSLESALLKRTGYTIRVKSFESLGIYGDTAAGIVQSAKNAVADKKIDFSFIDPYIFIKLRESGMEVHALVTWTQEGEPYDQGCLFIPEKGPSVTLDGLIGKRVIAVNANDLDLLNFLLYENGIKPPDKTAQFVFRYSKTAYSENNVENAANVVMSGLADAAFFKKSDLSLLAMRDKRLAALKPAACTSRMFNFPVVYREGIPLDLVDKMSDALRNAHKDPAFKDFRIYITALKAKFIPVKDKDYDSWKKFVEISDKYGWKTPENPHFDY